MKNTPPIVQAALHRNLIEQTRPLVIATGDQPSGSGFVLVDGDPARYGYDSHTLVELFQHLADLGVGTMGSCPLFLPLVELPSGHTVNLHWVPASPQCYLALTDADVCSAELRERQQAANNMTLRNAEKERVIRELEILRAECQTRSEALVEAQKFQRRLVEALAHDLRTPLTSICGYTSLLAARVVGDGAEEDRRALQAIDRASTVLGQTCENLLQLALLGENGEGERAERLDLASLMQDLEATMRPMAEAKGLELLTEVVDTQQRRPWGLRISLFRVLMNLLSNAIRYTTVGRVEARLEWDGDCIRLCVSDTGQGIAPEYQSSIFEPLNRGAQHGRTGTGLGLSIVREIVRAQGGELSLDSTVGVGSRFSVTIPEAAPPAERSASSATRASGAGIERPTGTLSESRRAVVVEDDPSIAELLVWVLREAGFDAQSAGSVDEGRSLIAAHRPDLILSDIEMGRQSGLRLVQDLRMAGYRGLIYVVSGSVSPQVHRAALSAGADAVFSKPLDLTRFRAILKALPLVD